MDRTDGRCAATYAEDGKRVYIKIAEKPRFSFTVTNSGKTPALNVRSIIAVWAYWPSEKFVPFYGQYDTVSTIQTLFPGARTILSTRSDLPEISGLQINGLLSGEYNYYVYGKITYEDVFKRPHKTTFCVYVARDFTFLNNCGTYNDAD